MRISNILLISFCILFSIDLYAQNKSWNLLLGKKAARFNGYHVYETDSFYLVLGTSIDSFGKVEQGFSISKVNKKDASVIISKHYEEKDVQFHFYQCRKGYLVGDEIIFPQSTLTKPFAIQLFTININTFHVEKILNVPPPDATSKYNMYLNDCQLINNDIFILAEYYIGEFNTPSLKGIQILIKYNLQTKETQIIKYIDLNEKITMLKISSFKDSLIVFGTVRNEQLATGKMAIFYLDLNGKLIWQYETPTLSPINNVKDIYPINDKEVLLASYDSFFDYSDLQLYTRWTVTRFYIENKKIIWSNFWNEPRRPFSRDTGKIIKTNKENEYLLMANDHIGTDTTNYNVGKVVRFTDTGHRLWQKTYYYHKGWGYRNDFYNIIRTKDQNYLIVGTENVIESPWLVKIDEDGNILPIDNTSAIAGPDIQNIIPEIKIYPNPASHTIIINQGEITDMTYQLTDMSGAVVKSIPLPYAHHHVVWDISDVASGTYVLTMWQGGKVIGSRQQVVVH